ncbi:hypothetical protein PAXINDRAFT_155801 [Paxillus involutus ATCC 200175]|uniref:Uncharacterized protein n=1 Tax=Paxillus involutus ATCC 200175 TaxID=664439 RepID=A0A0C9TY73_PAXIN|nr:hypothetical protein PAXINDRAFT_155801 [Paxillus involutus ATCC 200175]
MGQPKLYHTQVDKQRAMQGYRKTYYEKNRQRISERNKKNTARDKERSCRHAVIDRKECLNALPSKSSPLSPLKKVLNGRASPRTLEQVEDMEKHIRSVHTQVLQEKGVGHELRTVEVTVQRVKHVAHAIEDILLHGAKLRFGVAVREDKF